MQGEGRRGVAIVTAMGIEGLGLSRALEAGPWHRRLHRGWREGLLGTCPVVLATCGVGYRAARRWSNVLLEEYEPRLVILTGACAGVAPFVQVGDLVVGESVCRVAGLGVTARFPADPDILALAQEAAAAARLRPVGGHEPRVLAAAMASVDRLVARQAWGERLAREHGVLAIEMEAAAIAEACQGPRVPFLAVRAISELVGSRWQWLSMVRNLVPVQRNAERLVFALVQFLSEET